jgi:hypothetical protein
MNARPFVAIVCLALAGCASVEMPFRAHLDSAAAPLRECAEWYRDLDAEIDAAGVRDAQETRVRGFPYLRVDRLHASLRDRASASAAALQALADRLLELDLGARRHEIRNLPRGERDAAATLRRTGECGRLLREVDFAKPELRALALERLEVPDDYSEASRALGLYPLTRLVFHRGVARWEEEAAAAFRQPPDRTGRVRYAPPAGARLSRAEAAGLVERAALNALSLPLLSERELAQLAETYAPVFEVAVTGDHDRFGELRWRRDARTPEVEAARAAVYVHPAHTRYGERVLMQLVYTIWFPERPAAGAADIYAGRLDGLVWRVTLAPDGEPLIYDSIHPCGCYHKFFPTPRARPRPSPDPLEEWSFAPLVLGRVADGERPVVSIAARTHYIDGVRLERDAGSVARYAFHPYDELRSAALPEGGARSAFGPDGLVAGTERAERFLFWPMGIRSAGAMRQWGRQPTAFVGRRHFDDHDLMERRFALELTESKR